MKSEPVGKSWITVKYTDKSENDPDHYAATVLYDFSVPMTAILDSIEAGETSGVYVMGFGKGADVAISDAVPARGEGRGRAGHRRRGEWHGRGRPRPVRGEVTCRSHLAWR